jgi:DNA-binding LytR/AlgR family response regulator
LTSISSAIINDIAFNDGKFYLVSFVAFVGIVSIVAILPTILVILWHYIHTLKTEIRVSHQLTEKIQGKESSESTLETIVFASSNQKDQLSMLLSDFLYIQSADNYIDIYYLDNKTVKHELLRNTLAMIEKSFTENVVIQRCHLSYIVNTGAIESVLGNASGYKLQLKGTDEIIPVSRKYRKQLFEVLKH